MHYKAEDFLQDDSFISYCLQNDAAAIHFWKEYLAVHPEQAEEMKRAEHLYFVLNGNINAGVFSKDRNEFLDTFHAFQAEENSSSSVVQLPAERRTRKSLFIRISLGAAAAAAIIVIWVGYSHTEVVKGKPVTASLIQESRRGERKSFQLEDGTQVTLNAGSTLTVSKEFGHADRQVILHGEAFFDVSRDKNLPFLIHTEHMDVRVLGTIFNVKAYDGDRRSETSLISGSVEITLPGQGNRKVILHPAEKIVFDRDGVEDLSNKVAGIHRSLHPERFAVATLTHIADDSTYKEISWLDSRLAFNQESLGDIAEQLERWYNVSIVFSDTVVRQYHYTGTFQKKNIRQVLDALQLSKPFSYSIMDAQHVVITK